MKTLEEVRAAVKAALDQDNTDEALLATIEAEEARSHGVDAILNAMEIEGRSALHASEQREFDRLRDELRQLAPLKTMAELRHHRRLNDEANAVRALRGEEPRTVAEFREARTPKPFGQDSRRSTTVFGATARPLTPEQGFAMRAVESDVYSSDDVKQRAAELIETDESGIASRWAAVAADPEYMRAWTSLLIDPDRAHLGWTPQQRAAWSEAETVKRAMSIGTDASGGYLLPFALDPALILTNNGTISPMRRISRSATIATDKWHGITTAGVSAEWIAEATEVADASPSDLAQPEIPVHTWDTYVIYSIQAELDIPSLVNELNTASLDARDRLEATAFATGTGSGQPKGVITAVAANSGSIIAPTTAETFAVADVYKVAKALPARHQAHAQWAANYAIELEVRQFATGSGPSHAFWSDLGGDTPPRLLGKPWNQMSDMDGVYSAAATAAHNYLLLFGDFSKYLIVDRIGTTAEIVPHVLGSNRRPTLQRGLLTYGRTGADCLDTNAFRLLDIPTTA